MTELMIMALRITGVDEGVVNDHCRPRLTCLGHQSLTDLRRPHFCRLILEEGSVNEQTLERYLSTDVGTELSVNCLSQLPLSQLPLAQLPLIDSFP